MDKGNKLSPALMLVLQAAQEQAADTGKIDIDDIAKQILGKYTIDGRRIIKHYAKGAETSGSK